jgi:hypothetical protein
VESHRGKKAPARSDTLVETGNLLGEDNEPNVIEDEEEEGEEEEALNPHVKPEQVSQDPYAGLDNAFGNYGDKTDKPNQQHHKHPSRVNCSRRNNNGNSHCPGQNLQSLGRTQFPAERCCFQSDISVRIMKSLWYGLVDTCGRVYIYFLYKMPFKLFRWNPSPYQGFN